jgi:TolA-binding protein
MKNWVVLLFVSLFFLACSPSRQKQQKEIKSIENRLFGESSQGFNKASADTLINLYTGFADKYPEDSLTPGYLFKAANLAMTMQDGPQALTLFNRILTAYPDDPKSSMSLFFVAFVQENLMQNLDKAKETYLLFIEKYPESDFADDAQMSLMNLGKSLEQILQEREMKRKEDSARAKK